MGKVAFGPKVAKGVVTAGISAADYNSFRIYNEDVVADFDRAAGIPLNIDLSTMGYGIAFHGKRGDVIQAILKCVGHVKVDPGAGLNYTGISVRSYRPRDLTAALTQGSRLVQNMTGRLAGNASHIFEMGKMVVEAIENSEALYESVRGNLGRIRNAHYDNTTVVSGFSMGTDGRHADIAWRSKFVTGIEIAACLAQYYSGQDREIMGFKTSWGAKSTKVRLATGTSLGPPVDNV